MKKWAGIFLVGILLILAKPVLATSSSDSMIGYWKFDESAQGSTAADSSGDGNNLTPVGTSGGPSYSTDVPTTIFTDTHSAGFDGTQYETVASNSDLNFTGNMTIAAWVKFDTVNSHYKTIAGKWQIGVKQQYVFQLNSDNSIGFFTGNGSTGGGGISTSGTFTPVAGTWYHIAAVLSGTTGKIYINGVSKASGTMTALGTSDIDFSVGAKKNSSGSYSEFLDGSVDDLRLYNRALTSTEISDLAAGKYTTSFWSGGFSTNYEAANNWSPQAVPDPYTLAVVPSAVAFFPVLTSDESLAGLTINSGATFSTNCFSLTYNDSGSLTNNGTYNGCPVSSGSSSASVTASGPPSCNDSAPSLVPDLFQIDTAGTYANLYFTTTQGASGYRIAYGLDQNANQYGDSWSYSGPEWVLGRTINDLNPNTTYYFKVQAANGCNGGGWSQTVQVKTKNRLSDITKWFANLVSNHQTPQPAGSTSVLGASISCNYTIQPGDSLWKISQQKWGTGSKFSQILTLNPGLTQTSTLRVGQPLKLCQ